MKRYYLMFGGIYICAVILFGLTQAFLNLSLGGVSVIIPFLAAMITAQQFVKRERRAPDDSERNALTFGSFSLFLAINILFMALFLGLAGGFAGLFGETVPSGNVLGLIGVFIAAFLAIAFFMMRWAYGGLIRKQADKILKG